MKKYALLDRKSNIVKVVYDIDPYRNDRFIVVELTEDIVPTVKWYEKAIYDGIDFGSRDIEATDGSTVQQRYTGIKYKVIPKFENRQLQYGDLVKVIEEYTKENNEILLQKTEALSKDYSTAEKDTWDRQLQEAKLYLENNEASVPLLTALSTNRNISLTELANRIVNKANDYAFEYGKILGEYQKNKDVIASVDPTISTTWNNLNNYKRL
jgi:hypothetical protein